jgi:4'-phosphopantetheinyl transferase
MAPPLVHRGTGTQGFAQAYAPAPPPIAVVGVSGQAERTAARRRIREAALAALAAMTGLEPTAIRLHAAPGQAPYALLGDHGTARRAALSISHDGELSLAAIRLDGAVGVDVMHIAEVPDWQAVARDYLGPSTAAALSALAPDRRAAAFARAWTEREARLKCLGIPLAEWGSDGECESRLAACRSQALTVPEGYVGSLAWMPDASYFAP